MSGRLRAAWAGSLLAALTALGLIEAGVSLPVIAGVMTIWAFSLWLVWRATPAPPPPVIAPRLDSDAITQAAMRAAIEQIDVPLLLAHGHRVVAANAAARAALGPHVVGQDSRIALRHPDAVSLLELADGGSTTVRGLTGARSLWQLTRRRVDANTWMIELRDRNAEADISRAHTDFVANASHELRTPLASIIGYVETLAEAPGQFDSDTTARFLGTVLREARRMQSLVADLMSLSQLEAEKHDTPRDRVDFGVLADRVTSEFSHDGASRVEFIPPTAPIGVTGDTGQLEQLLRNLIDNALKYGDGEKPVKVGMALGDRGDAVLTITDHGAGISADHLPHLTRRFYRADPGRSRAAGGTGLGLAIVKHVVERHRGRLDIASTVGQGTTVTVRLPVTGIIAP